jgi:hypothetical protein
MGEDADGKLLMPLHKLLLALQPSIEPDDPAYSNSELACRLRARIGMEYLAAWSAWNDVTSPVLRALGPGDQED